MARAVTPLGWIVAGTQRRTARHVPQTRRGWETTRRVWLAVSTDPHASVRELAQQTGMAWSNVRHHLRLLRDVYGYIDFTNRRCRARTVLVPLRKGKIVWL